jgi:hypothetical protein
LGQRKKKLENVAVRAREARFERAPRAGIFWSFEAIVGIGEPLSNVAVLRVAAVDEALHELDGAVEFSCHVRFVDLALCIDRTAVFDVPPLSDPVVMLEGEPDGIDVTVARAADRSAADQFFEPLACRPLERWRERGDGEAVGLRRNLAAEDLPVDRQPAHGGVRVRVSGVRREKARLRQEPASFLRIDLDSSKRVPRDASKSVEVG